MSFFLMQVHGPHMKMRPGNTAPDPSTENAVIGTELVFSLSSLALHEFPSDIFTNEDRRQGAVVLHVLCVSTLLVALLEDQRGRRVGGWAVWCPHRRLPSLLFTHLLGGPLSLVG